MIIKTDDLRGPEIQALLQEHLRNMALHSPPESVHALDINALRKPGITFWTAWNNADLLGCGALKLLDAQRADDAPHAEIKSMRTAAAHLRKGVARALLSHIIGVARQRGYARLSLETGPHRHSNPPTSFTRTLVSSNAGRLRATRKTRSASS